MATHYETLGIGKDASPDEIKTAYRRKASIHHPDKGGDKETFQQIQAAYDVLSDPQKKEAYDTPAPRFEEGFQQYNGMPPEFEDMISQIFRGSNPFSNMFGNRHQHPVKNKTLNIQATRSLEEAYNGKDLMANLTLPSGRDQILEIKIPAGIQDGTVLRLGGIGDDSISSAPKGDIHLTVNVSPHKIFQRSGDDLTYDLKISCIDAMVGKTVQITTLDLKTLELQIKSGIQNGQILAAAGYGMPKMSDNRFRGRLLIVVNIEIPNNLTDAQKQILREHF